MDSHSSSDSSLLLWALGVLVLLLAAHVLVGWIREAMDRQGLRRVWAVATGAAAFGTAHCVAMALGLAGEPLGFAFGYHPGAVLGLWLGSILLVIPVSLLPVARRDGATAAAAGLLMALVVTAVQVGWISAGGFRPGLSWDASYLALATTVGALGFGCALILAFPRQEWARHYRYSWRVGAAGLIALSFLIGFSLVLSAADLPAQISSLYRRTLPGTMLALLAGSVLPLVLAVLVVDLEIRRRHRRRALHLRRRGAATSANSMFFELSPEELEALTAASQDHAARQASLEMRQSVLDAPLAAPVPATAPARPPAAPTGPAAPAAPIGEVGAAPRKRARAAPRAKAAAAPAADAGAGPGAAAAAGEAAAAPAVATRRSTARRAAS